MAHDAPLDDATIARIADRASCDPRSVVRRLAGLPVKGRAGARIDAAIAEWRGGGMMALADAPRVRAAAADLGEPVLQSELVRDRQVVDRLLALGELLDDREDPAVAAGVEHPGAQEGQQVGDDVGLVDSRRLLA